jgi:hypothetical protein
VHGCKQQANSSAGGAAAGREDCSREIAVSHGRLPALCVLLLSVLCHFRLLPNILLRCIPSTGLVPPAGRSIDVVARGTRYRIQEIVSEFWTKGRIATRVLHVFCDALKSKML